MYFVRKVYACLFTKWQEMMNVSESNECHTSAAFGKLLYTPLN